MMNKLFNIAVFFIAALTASILAFNPAAGEDLKSVEATLEIVRLDQAGQAPDFEAFDLDRNSHRLSDYKNRLLLLNFWATWCLPCLREMPKLDRLHQVMSKNDFAILAINVMDRESRVKKYLSKNDYSFHIALDRDGNIYKAYGVKQFPTTLIIGRSAKLLGKIQGDRDWNDPRFISYFRELIRKGL